MPRHVRYRLAALLVLVVLLVVLSVVIDVPGVGELRRQYAGTGLLGALAFALVYAALSMLPLPAAVFTIAAGAVFGLTRGVLIVAVGANLGAVAAFYLGRLLGRDGVTHFTGTRLETLDAFLGRRGFLAVLIVRLIPVVPFAAVNYLSGLTGLRVSRYVAGTVLGSLPATVLYVAVGAYGSRPGSWPFVTALVALVLLTVGGVLAARRHRRNAADSGLT